jgi:hypothetical protein
MANTSYFESHPEIVKLFDDLEAYRDYCRMEMMPFNEADLYNREVWTWRHFEKSRRPKKAFTGERKPYLGNKPRYNNNERFSN